MDVETFTEYCLKKKGAFEDFPFNEDTLVFKVMNKIFALIPLEKIPLQINLKCDPELAVELREKYDSVIPAYHMNKTKWITIISDNTVPDKEVFKLIDLSYDLVVKGLKKADRAKLEEL